MCIAGYFLIVSFNRTMSGHDENVEAFSYRCLWLWGETDYVSSYDIWWCPQLFHVGRPRYPNPCWCQLCQTLGGVYLIEAIEYSTKKWLNGAANFQNSSRCFLNMRRFVGRSSNVILYNWQHLLCQDARFSRTDSSSQCSTSGIDLQGW